MKRSYHHPFIDRNQKHDNNKLENVNNCREQKEKTKEQMNEEIDRNSITSVKSSVSQH